MIVHSSQRRELRISFDCSYYQISYKKTRKGEYVKLSPPHMYVIGSLLRCYHVFSHTITTFFDGKSGQGWVRKGKKVKEQKARHGEWSAPRAVIMWFNFVFGVTQGTILCFTHSFKHSHIIFIVSVQNIESTTFIKRYPIIVSHILFFIRRSEKTV